MAQISEMQKPTAGVGQFFCALSSSVMAEKEADWDGALADGWGKVWAVAERGLDRL